MSPPLSSPLIPLPQEDASPIHDDKNDLFATLFLPPTPKASPTSTSVDTKYVREALAKHHSRTESTDTEFGSFVSVQSTEDPLNASGYASGSSALSPMENIQFFDRFTEDARAATGVGKHDLLDELLRNQNDPLYFLRSSPNVDASRTTTPTPSSPHPTQSVTEVRESLQEQPLLDFGTEVIREEVRDPRRLTRQQSRSEFGGTRSRSPPLRSPSLPPSSPPRISDPEVQRAQSSFFTPASLPSRWVSSLLSNTVRQPPSRTRASTEELRDSEHRSHVTLHEHSTSATLPSHLLDSFSNLTRPSVVSTGPAASSTSTVPIDAAITHGSPFASHAFVPASGAPGFAGDRQWDKGFDFDKSHAERKSVRLVGRREVTTPLLTVELADMLRPHFPALARLPRTWSLLYSLDQHGISLNTLYNRCQNHTGAALVIMRDSGDAIFGAWMGEGIHQSKGAYYGSGESFLWRLAVDKQLRVYKWTGKNDYVALCEPEYLSFGGGDGHYGLYLDNSLIDGSSAWCPTFNNEPLCSAGPRQGENIRFECVGLEVWGVG